MRVKIKSGGITASAFTSSIVIIYWSAGLFSSAGLGSSLISLPNSEVRLFD
jgi:hypothetical protein